MPEEQPDTVPEEGGEEKRKSVLPLIAVALLALGGGGALGMQSVGPKLGTALAERSLAQAAETEKKSDAPLPLHVVDNLVVNPAGSGGSRFLLTSIALQAEKADQVTILKDRDVEIRDAFVKVLSSMTVEQLTDPSGRQALSDKLLAATARIVGPGVVHRLYIPQFVIQ